MKNVEIICNGLPSRPGQVAIFQINAGEGSHFDPNESGYSFVLLVCPISSGTRESYIKVG